MFISQSPVEVPEEYRFVVTGRAVSGVVHAFDKSTVGGAVVGTLKALVSPS